MKYTLLLLVAFVSALSFSSCTEDGEQRLEIPITVSDFTVNAFSPNASYKTFTTEVITSNISTQLAAFGYTLDNVKKIEPKNIVLTLTGAGNTFNNLDYMDAFVSADGVNEIKVAYSDGIPANANVLTLKSQFSDIAPAVTKPAFTFRVGAYNNAAYGPVTGSVTLTVDVIVEK